jgi:hypothetical protein
MGGPKMLKTVEKNLVLIMIVILGLSSIVSAIAAEPSLVEISISPQEPEPLATVTFNATLTSEEIIDEVWITVKECKTGLCFTDDQNVSMENIEGTNYYEVDVTLLHDDATYITFSIDVYANNTWYQLRDFENVTLAAPSNGNGNTQNGNNNGNGNGNDTPGFEIIFVILALIIGFIFFTRKRSR